MRDHFVALAAALAVAATACGAQGRRPEGDDEGDEEDPPIPGEPDQSGCSENAKLIFVVDENDTLSRFDPIAKTFMDIGKLDCPASGTPFSMGIDRNAGAWVLYSSKELFKVDTETLACTNSKWSSPALTEFGMGFSTDEVGGATDRLFIAGGTSTRAAKASLNTIDTTSLTVTHKGEVVGQPELTGTGNAELWGFFPGMNSATPRIEQIDKEKGTPLKTFSLPGLRGEPQAWAFAFFGGDFFVFLMTENDSATRVYQVNGADGSVRDSFSTQSRRIVGAGVSTCAPVVIF
jgi:hypothetical protein